MAVGSHFKGKSVFEHLKEARKKGFLAARENHGIEAAGHIIGGADSAKETAIYSMLVWIVCNAMHISYHHIYSLIGITIFGLLLWKTGRSASLGWNRIERVNKLIEDEKWEIENNREEEKSELTEMYRAKGFSGQLLDRVIEVLMADDNKLLGVMLEEELGVSLESYEHPLKQALGAAVGVLLSACVLLIGLAISEPYGLYFSGFIIVGIASYVMSKIEKTGLLHVIVWNLAIAFLATSGTYFLAKVILGGKV